MRDALTKRYWINEHLLKVPAGGDVLNIAVVVIQIIDAYVEAKRDAFDGFLDACQKMRQIRKASPAKVKSFVADLLKPNVDAKF